MAGNKPPCPEDGGKNGLFRRVGPPGGSLIRHGSRGEKNSEHRTDPIDMPGIGAGCIFILLIVVVGNAELQRVLSYNLCDIAKSVVVVIVVVVDAVAGNSRDVTHVE